MKRGQTIFNYKLGWALCLLLAGGNLPEPFLASTPTMITRQANTITGKVTDGQGEPLLGVNVVIQGTTLGTITDMDGRFTLEANPGDIIVFSYIGYVSQTVPASKKEMAITLKEDSQNLDEVVVVLRFPTEKRHHGIRCRCRHRGTACLLRIIGYATITGQSSRR